MKSIIIAILILIVGTMCLAEEASDVSNPLQFRYGYVMRDNSVMLEVPNVEENRRFFGAFNKIIYDTTLSRLQGGEYRMLDQIPEEMGVKEKIGDRFVILAGENVLYGTLDGFAVTESPFAGFIPGGHIVLDDLGIELPRCSRRDYSFVCAKLLILNFTALPPVIGDLEKIVELEYDDYIPVVIKNFEIEIEPFIPYSAELQCWPTFYKYSTSDDKYITSRKCNYKTYYYASRYFLATRIDNDEFRYEEITPEDLAKSPTIHFLATFTLMGEIYFFARSFWYESECLSVYKLKDGRLRQVSKSNIFGV